MSIGIVFLAVSIVDGITGLQFFLAISSIEKTRTVVALLIANAISKVFPTFYGGGTVSPWIQTCYFTVKLPIFMIVYKANNIPKEQSLPSKSQA